MPDTETTVCSYIDDVERDPIHSAVATSSRGS